MKKKTKTGGPKPHPQPDQQRTHPYKTEISGGVFVRGEVQTNLSPSEIKKSDAAAEKHETRENKRYLVEKLTLLAVIIYAGLTAYQTYIGQQSLSLLHQQLVLDQRPYLTVNNIEFLKDADEKTPHQPVVGMPLAIDVFFTNTGKTPALNFRIVRYIFFGKGARDKLKAQRIYPADDKGNILEAGVIHKTTIWSVYTNMSTQQAAVIQATDFQMWDGSRPILVFGNFFYDDAFGNSYCTPFGSEFLQGAMWLEVLGENPTSCDKPKKK